MADPVGLLPDTVLTAEQLATALNCSVDSIERADLPCTYITPKLRRYVWRQVIDVLMARAAQ